jgi:hypothetical protein
MSEAVPDQYALSFDPIDLARSVFYDADAVRTRRRRALPMAAGVLALALLGLFFFSLIFDWNFDVVWRYELVALAGGSVGTAELLSRYRDAPTFVLLSAPGLTYITINALASVIALAVILTFDWSFGVTGEDAIAATQLLMASFGAMALFAARFSQSRPVTMMSASVRAVC